MKPGQVKEEGKLSIGPWKAKWEMGAILEGKVAGRQLRQTCSPLRALAQRINGRNLAGGRCQNVISVFA